MNSYFVVTNHAEIKLNDFTKGYSQGEDIDGISFQKGDHLEITNEGFFVNGEGWFILVVINEHIEGYASFNDLEEWIEQKIILNVADLEIKRSLWRDQINQALEKRNKDWFKFLSRKLTSLESIGY